jgi:hypothetical protein
MEKGVIFKAKEQHRKDGAVHPIIFGEKYDNSSFLGLMITHSPDYDNVDLSDNSYFESNPDDFKSSNFVLALLLKPVDWISFPIILGKLSPEGIDYLIAKGIDRLNPVSWEDYLKD